MPGSGTSPSLPAPTVAAAAAVIVSSPTTSRRRYRLQHDLCSLPLACTGLGWVRVELSWPPSSCQPPSTPPSLSSPLLPALLNAALFPPSLSRGSSRTGSGLLGLSFGSTPIVLTPALAAASRRRSHSLSVLRGLGLGFWVWRGARAHRRGRETEKQRDRGGWEGGRGKENEEPEWNPPFVLFHFDSCQFAVNFIIILKQYIQK